MSAGTQPQQPQTYLGYCNKYPTLGYSTVPDNEGTLSLLLKNTAGVRTVFILLIDISKVEQGVDPTPWVELLSLVPGVGYPERVPGYP